MASAIASRTAARRNVGMMDAGAVAVIAGERTRALMVCATACPHAPDPNAVLTDAEGVVEIADAAKRASMANVSLVLA